MPLIEPSIGQILADHLPHRVYTRERWFEDWQEQPHLYANRVFTCCSPEVPSAEIVWRFGEAMLPGQVKFAAADRKSLLDRYVKVEIDQPDDDEGNPQDPITWIGYVLEEATARGGAFLRGEDFDERKLTGDQTFLAYGLEIQLQQTILETSWYWDSTAKKKVLLRRAVTFNAEHGYQAGTRILRGNRTAGKEADDCYQFSDALKTAQKWSTRDIVEYLVQYMSPRANDDTVYIPWKLSDRAKQVLPAWDEPVVPCDGRTVKSVLDQLLDRRRLFSYRLAVVENEQGGEEVELDVFSFNDQLLEMPNGRQQPANEDTVELDFDRAVDVTSAVLRDSAGHKVEQVRVVGARKRSIFSISPLDATLEADWDPADATAYGTGPPGIAGLDINEQEDRVKNWAAHERFERVFSWFRLPADWDGFVGNGEGGGLNYCFPDDERFPQNDPRRREKFYMPELRFARSLPRDLYPSAPDASPDQDPPPIALLKTDCESKTYYQFLHRLGEPGTVELIGDGSGRGWSCSLQVQRDAPGIVVRVSGGPGRHAIASADFAGNDLYAPAELNWRNNLVVTVMLELDSRVEAVWPAEPWLMGQPLDVARIATVEIGEKGRLDYICPGTVVDHEDGTLYRTLHANTFLHDDRQYMEDLARLLYEWYGIKRQAFTFQFRQLSRILSVGQIITKIGSGDTEEEVNSVVTGVQWDLLSGQTQVTTGFAEIDPTQL